MPDRRSGTPSRFPLSQSHSVRAVQPRPPPTVINASPIQGLTAKLKHFCSDLEIFLTSKSLWPFSHLRHTGTPLVRGGRYTFLFPMFRLATVRVCPFGYRLRVPPTMHSLSPLDLRSYGATDSQTFVLPRSVPAFYSPYR
jgi:hypothetical protein